MYERVYGTDWRTISDEEAIRRMYALGVSSALGYPNRGEFERIRRQAGTAYGRSVLQLAFEEGKQRVARNKGEYDSKQDVWEALVDENATPSTTGRADVSMQKPTDKQGIPKAVDRIDVLDAGTDDFSQLRLPEFLRRE
ncbi:hypothetical protein E6P09_00255 [Haloferax mediterranei ATCC 33500]|uniref:Uncharacterized protein n=1 Tax=Haloferax mediterranei (strain ATCC 33500 / DSM 1411 / JCM 8866 / NBRC 14739 / NCIMB 2177 / R-4) TaxID=523841 RepID=I3R6W3_HALMT|nr:hypothetical protein [Haloferax mediterranei]AFK19973.1 hypothetical protein HFX_2286 [Haloferax mediterranei ATCC 33500]AHZ23350.1 hypothetical protein BM92_12200 [Haloferax mediterranei ATCC 33500]ELZ99518.1 hypothetical protein C439_13229 [Haloferax mediterranei ATCC 33500]MDX5987276.1 hypothetical protein [Haloferax mediterranei ATCC 33500]QCQ73797.1 hypothetical protein E6P09_00255 [Haloferax mediterranei ATCC 33500]